MKSYKDIVEALKGNQHKIDKNKNGKIDAHDFKLLRKEESEIEESEERMARSDYKMSPSGRKSHKEIVFNNGDDKENEKEEMKEEMTDAQMKKREEIVKSMKKDMAGFKDRYGDQAKSVMYATATKMAMKEEQFKVGDFVKDPDGKIHRIFGVNGTNLETGVHYGKNKYGGTNNLHTSKAKKVSTPQDVKEEIEELDEKSDQAKQNKTMKNLMAASKGAQINRGLKLDPAEYGYKKAQHLNKAIGRAAMRAEETEIEEEKKETPPFDGPYTKTPGTVKDKSGAEHTPMSRVRHLARMAMKKQMKEDIDRLFEAKEKTEYDFEGDMARGQLQSIVNNAQKVHDMLKDNDNLPEWVQSKITLAEDYISTVANYMMSELDEQAPVAPVPGQKFKDHAVMVNGKQRVVIQRKNVKNYPEHEGWKEVSPGHKIKEEDEVQFSYAELMMMLEYESKGGVYRHTGTYGSEYAKKEREKDEKGFDADDKPTTNLTKRGRGRPAGSKSGARGPRIK